MVAVLERRTTPAGRDAIGWSAVAAIAATLAVSWWQPLFLPLGDSHDGRIMGRFALHVRNYWESGLLGSGLLTDISPFPTESYAHHPPLTNVAHIAISAVLGQGEWQLRALGYVSGVATIFAIAWLLRTLTFGWPATLAGLAATGTTAMFWLYARLGPGFWLAVVLVTLAIRTRRQEGSVRGLVTTGFLCAVLSWEAAAIAILVTLWLLQAPAMRTAARALATAVGAGLGITAVWILTATDVGELAQHTTDRVTAAGIGLRDYLDQQWWFYSSLFPLWYLVVIVPGLIAAWFAGAERRFVVGVFVVVGVAFAVGLPEASFIHDYWTKILLVPFGVGIAALVERIPRLSERVGVAVLALVIFAGWMTGDERQWFETAYFDDASAAGGLLLQMDPPADQEIGWVVGAIALPRWMSWYWDMPVETLEPEMAVDPDDLVLVRWDRLPPWYPSGSHPPTASDLGRYSLVEAQYVLPGP